MPNVLEINGYKIYIYTHDHTAHVHVIKAEMEVEIYLATLDIKRQNRHATGKFIREAWEVVSDNQEFLQSEWDRIQPVP